MRACPGGRCGASTLSAGILVISNASSAALTTMRRPSLVAADSRIRRCGAARASAASGSRHCLMLRVRSSCVHPRAVSSAADGPVGGRPARDAARRLTIDDGVALAAVAWGSPDAPGLLLVHGFGGAKEDFADHVDALAADHRVVVFDHRGHGQSDAPTTPRAYSLDRLAADTLAVADAFGLRELRLLGHSMGGMVDAPPRARASATRVCPRVHGHVAGRPCRDRPGPRRRRRRPSSQPEGMAALRARPDELDLLGSPAYQRVLAERPGFREYADRKWASLSPVMWVDVGARDHRPARPARRPSPPQWTSRRSSSSARRTRCSSRRLRDIAEAMPGARLVVIPDAGHSPQFENPTPGAS